MQWDWRAARKERRGPRTSPSFSIQRAWPFGNTHGHRVPITSLQASGKGLNMSQAAEGCWWRWSQPCQASMSGLWMGNTVNQWDWGMWPGQCVTVVCTVPRLSSTGYLLGWSLVVQQVWDTSQHPTLSYLCVPCWAWAPVIGSRPWGFLHPFQVPYVEAWSIQARHTCVVGRFQQSFGK